jgi:hypothetical protein
MSDRTMLDHRWLIGLGIATVLASCAVIAAAQLPLDPMHTSGQSITPAYEGWYTNKDGSNTILIGYYSRNQKAEMDIPIGPNNRMEPGGPDRGQPTHFGPGRQWGVFTVTVPKDFGPPPNKITWTIVANGQPMSIPFALDPLWVVSPFTDATDNTPPFIAFSDSGPFIQGPPREIGKSLTGTVGSPVDLTVWVADDAKIPPGVAAGGGGGRFGRPSTPATITWNMFRGPGKVTFAAAKPKVETATFKAPPPAVFTGKASTTATFSDPGEYILEVVGNDISGEGGRGFQCCWTTVQVKVTVTGEASASR